MKNKKLIFCIIICVICIMGYKMIQSDNGSNLLGSSVEKDLIATLPEDITVCYCIHNDNDHVLNNLEVTNFTIDRESTDGNFKSADCTIELEGNDIKMTAYVNLSCIKYDDGSWQVESCSEISKPTVTPKYQPDESRFIWNIQRYEELYSLTKVNEYIDLDHGEITYFYSVLDAGFSGNGVSCTAIFKDTGTDYYDKDVYYWKFSNEVN